MSGTCSRCGQPFAASEKHDPNNPTATWRAERRPHCAPNKLGKEKATLDCVQYIRSDRVSARLRDGFAMLAEDRG